MAGHAARTTPDDSPLLYAFMAMDMDERWAARDPAIMLDTFHWFRGEGFGLIVEDLAEIRRGTIVEGFRLLPHLVRPQLGEGDRAVWLLPTPEFRRHAFTVRGDLYKIAGRTRDPERALANLLERDALFTDRLAAEAAALDLPVIAVDGSRTLGELIAAVEATFDL
ncbi:hypothetical protein [Hamadaea tsunoensis]|uniref:hypothetical protein n=1 Tax=Hamadaea tsunoensis TaxID=53368 RepID=UPI0004003576|nr:hypothetical protein [Hamadaea tsunoensis]